MIDSECTLCFISRVIWIEKSSLSWCNVQFFILGWQTKEWTIPNKLSGENSPILCQNGAIVTFMVPPRKYECVPDWYKNLHFRPLLISLHFWLTSFIDFYTRNAFSFSGSVQKLHHGANMVALFEKRWWQNICTGYSFKLSYCSI